MNFGAGVVEFPQFCESWSKSIHLEWNFNCFGILSIILRMHRTFNICRFSSRIESAIPSFGMS